MSGHTTTACNLGAGVACALVCLINCAMIAATGSTILVAFAGFNAFASALNFACYYVGKSRVSA